MEGQGIRLFFIQNIEVKIQHDVPRAVAGFYCRSQDIEWYVCQQSTFKLLNMTYQQRGYLTFIYNELKYQGLYSTSSHRGQRH